MTKNERFKQARLKSGKGQQELANELGVSQSYIGGLEKDQAFSFKKAKVLAPLLNVDAEWLYFGDKTLENAPKTPRENTLNAGGNDPNFNHQAKKSTTTSYNDGDDLTINANAGAWYSESNSDKINQLRGVMKDVQDRSRSKVEAVQQTNNTDIPMFAFPGSASVVQMYNDELPEVAPIGQLRIPGAQPGSFALPVYGHSMYPTLENGNWCILRPISDPSDIDYGEVYYVEYGDYRVYKRLLKIDDDEESILLWSDNQSEVINGKPKYAAKKIRVERIRKLCILTEILKKPNY